MPHTVEIKVHMIAKTKVDCPEASKWLKEVGVSSEGCTRVIDPADKSDAEILVELAGRRCYKSFEVDAKLNPNITKIREDIVEYIDNILKVGHGCYDAETEVLTRDGWKRWEDVSKCDEFATRAVDGRIEYQKPTALVSAPYSGKMYRVDAQGVDLLVTPNHKMLVCKTTTKAGRKKESFSLIEAQELGLVSHAYTKVGYWDSGHGENSSLDANILRLIGFAIGDGYIDERAQRARFHLYRERKIIFLMRLCRELGWACKTGNDGKYDVTIPNDYVDLFRSLYNEEREKIIPQQLMFLTQKKLEALFEGLMQADGCVQETGDSYDTTSEKLAGQIQQLCLHLGIAANMSQAPSYKERKASYGKKPLHRLSIVRRVLKPEVNKWADAEGRSYWVDQWEGDVYCAEVPNHTLYVRRNGKPVWCGNSVIEHVSFTFSIENVSRVFTGEMNRHRAGVAISEGSMRFIRYDDIGYWCPTSIQTDRKMTREMMDRVVNSIQSKGAIPCDALADVEVKKKYTQQVFHDVFTFVERAYENLAECWKDELALTSKFKFKKEVTSMMRRIIPMGVATGGVWTGNLRALRHIFVMRCSPVAEEEILLVATKMLNIMRKEEPSFFGDYTTDEEGFSTPKYKKV